MTIANRIISNPVDNSTDAVTDITALAAAAAVSNKISPVVPSNQRPAGTTDLAAVNGQVWTYQIEYNSNFGTFVGVAWRKS
jgi:nitrate/nitrite transporter NarK